MTSHERWWRRQISQSYIAGGQTCSIGKSFAENQKHQRAAKPVCSVITVTEKIGSFTENDLQQLKHNKHVLYQL